MGYIKSPLNYVGGKFKLLPQILPLFPENINRFIDLFAGGCNVGINVNAKTIVCNDILTPVVDLLNGFKIYDTNLALAKIDELIKWYDLDKINKDGYLKLREYYNNGARSWDVFYTLICHSFSNQIRFNSKGNFNMPHGKRTFNPTLRKRFINFVDEIHNKNIHFTNTDFRELKIENLTSNDFVYIDPPYYLSKASYNENGGWSEQDERDLLALLDQLDKHGVKFALSNVLESKGREHTILKEWSEKYIVNYLDANYGNCNYQRKDKSKDVEVLIINYLKE